MKHALVLLLLAACGGSAPKTSPIPGDVGAKKPQELPLGSTTPGGGGEGGDGGCKGGSDDPLGSCSPSKGVLEEGEMTTVGAIDKGIVRKVVRENFEALRYCYEATLLANPNIAGTVLAKFTIQIDGTVHDVTASGVHPDVETCIATKVRGFRFPKPDSSKVEVAYPFTFKPS